MKIGLLTDAPRHGERIGKGKMSKMIPNPTRYRRDHEY